MTKGDNAAVGLILYDASSTYTNAVYDSLTLLKNMNFPLSFIDFRKFDDLPLEAFDFIILHYSVRLPFNFLSGLALLKLKASKVFKVIWIQDEQDGLDLVLDVLTFINPDLVLSTIQSKELRDEIYGAKGIDSINIMTGYNKTPEKTEHYSFEQFQGRSVDCFYRGRLLPGNYGKLGYLKGEYSIYLDNLLQNMGLKTDFSIKDQDRIYGEGWPVALRNSKAVYFSDSGSNVFDFSFGISNLFRLEKRPFRSNFSNWFSKELNASIETFENLIDNGQISPKLFEIYNAGAIVITHENSCLGRYGFEPGVHYIETSSTDKHFNNLKEFLNSFEAYQMALRGREQISKKRFSESNFVNLLKRRIQTALAKRVTDKKNAHGKFNLELVEIEKSTRFTSNNLVVSLHNKLYHLFAKYAPRPLYNLARHFYRLLRK